MSRLYLRDIIGNVVNQHIGVQGKGGFGRHRVGEAEQNGGERYNQPEGEEGKKCVEQVAQQGKRQIAFVGFAVG